MKNSHAALAIGVAYVLGRRRKLRAAMVLGAAAATGRLGRSPFDLLRRRLTGDAGRSAAGPIARLGEAARSAVTRPAETLADRINERAEVLRRGAGGAQNKGR